MENFAQQHHQHEHSFFTVLNNGYESEIDTESESSVSVTDSLTSGDYPCTPMIKRPRYSRRVGTRKQHQYGFRSGALQETSDSNSSASQQSDNQHFTTPIKEKRRKAKVDGCNPRQARHYRHRKSKSNSEVKDQGSVHVAAHSTLTCTVDEEEISQSETEVPHHSDDLHVPLPTSSLSETSADNTVTTTSVSESSESGSESECWSTSCSSSSVESSDKYDSDVVQMESNERIKRLTDDSPLYEGCNHSKLSLYTALALLNMKHNCTGEFISDVLRMIKSLLPERSGFSPSLYKFKETLKEFSGYEEPEMHYFCSGCHSLLTTGNDICPCQSQEKKVLEFVGLNVDKQIQELFADENFCQLVQQRHHSEPGILRDVTDGEAYKKASESAETRTDVIHLSFTMNTDGVAVFKSSKKGNLWPVYLAINELPVQLRFSKRYIVPCSMYCQVEKPNMLTYLQPLMKKFKLFQEEGLQVATPYGPKLFKGHLLMAPLDLPARALVTNMKQFNGRYACVFCNDSGETDPVSRMQVRYPFNEDCVRRTHDSIIDDAKKATVNHEPERGIKGASALAMLKDVDLSEAFPVDWMHCVLLGVVKALLKFWLHTDYRAQKSFYIGKKIALLDKRLLKIHAPDFVVRKQRSLSDCQHWKATECREWLVHYSVPVLEGVLVGDPFIHFCLLVSAVAKLSKEAVSQDEVEQAEEMILDFCRLFPDIYGFSKQTMNVHLLRHLPQCVKLYGPVYHFSNFGFESMNSTVKSMIHGSRHVNSQIAFAVGITKSLPSMLQSVTEARKNEEINALFRHLSSRIIREYNVSDGKEEGSFIGKGEKLEVDYHAVCEQLGFQPQDVTAFKRYKHRDGQIVANSKKPQNSAIALSTNEGRTYGRAKTFVSNNIDHRQYVIVEVLAEKRRVVNFPTGLNPLLHKYCDAHLCSHVVQVKKKGRYKVFPVSSITRKCVLMDLGKKMYLSSPQNLLEHG